MLAIIVSVVFTGLLITSLTLLFLYENDPGLPYRAAWRFIMCSVLHFHHDEVMALGYYKVSLVEPTFKRRWLRTRVMKCLRCTREVTMTDVRSVAKDWSYPERLFR